MKRIFLFLMINLMVMVTIGVLCSVFGIDRYFVGGEVDVSQLMAFSAVVGFSGSFISLLMSKTIAVMTTGAKVIARPETAEEIWLVETVDRMSPFTKAIPTLLRRARLKIRLWSPFRRD